MSERQTKAGNQITLSLSLTLTLAPSHNLTLSHSHTHSISHSITLDMLNNFCFHIYAQNSPSHFLTLSRYLTLSHSHSLSISHSITEQVLFSCLGSKVTVYSRKLQCFFLDLHSSHTVSTDIRAKTNVRVN